jgi:predicted RNA-binding Zn ribbon-like protein
MPNVAAGGRIFEADDFVGGALCLDFANSVDSWCATPPPERLGTFADWMSWSAAARTLNESELRALDRRAGQDPAGARRALERARAARDALQGVLGARLARRTPSRSDLAVLGSAIAAARAQRRLGYANGRFVETWVAEGSDFERLLWPVMLDAEALLLDSESLQRLNRCPAENCGWLFIDTSRNRSRRWCSMRDCGNIAKAKRHYARVRRTRNARERK